EDHGGILTTHHDIPANALLRVWVFDRVESRFVDITSLFGQTPAGDVSATKTDHAAPAAPKVWAPREGLLALKARIEQIAAEHTADPGLFNLLVAIDSRELGQGKSTFENAILSGLRLPGYHTQSIDDPKPAGINKLLVPYQAYGAIRGRVRKPVSG